MSIMSFLRIYWFVFKCWDIVFFMRYKINFHVLHTQTNCQILTEEASFQFLAGAT